MFTSLAYYKIKKSKLKIKIDILDHFPYSRTKAYIANHLGRVMITPSLLLPLTVNVFCINFITYVFTVLMCVYGHRKLNVDNIIKICRTVYIFMNIADFETYVAHYSGM